MFFSTSYQVHPFKMLRIFKEDDDNDIDETQLRIAFKASRIQNAVQRAKLPKVKIADEDDIGNLTVPDVSANEGLQVKLNSIENPENR